MTALPAIKLPPECECSFKASLERNYGSGYSFAAAGRDCCHCAEYGDLRDAWLDKQDKRDGQGNLYRFHDLTEHIHTCPACRLVAGAFTPPSDELRERLETGRIWDTTERIER